MQNPDATFILDLDCHVSDKRISLRGNDFDRLELEDIDFKQRVREGFLLQAKRYPDRICVIDAMQSPDKIFENILNRIKQMEV